MAITKKKKDELVNQYKDLIENSEALFIAEYAGMHVQSLEALRTKAYEANGSLHVTKNTLLKHALEEGKRPVSDKLLNGQLVTGFARTEAPAMAKVFVDFIKSDDKFKIRGGILGNQILTAQQVEALAKMPAMPQIRAQLLGILSAPSRNIASAIASGVRQVINVVDAYAKSEDKESAEAAA